MLSPHELLINKQLSFEIAQIITRTTTMTQQTHNKQVLYVYIHKMLLLLCV